ncbi:hypothetical protein [Winogradskyella sp. MH6]|jgi:hypothetical protein|uniref:hypothetical protein n=1 Tax=Winogradskyella sp. MH6 TaxID=2929510 RepID=UPI001FB22D51|nr:hypothetical protein [Winogradskyella sp. MH6]
MADEIKNMLLIEYQELSTSMRSLMGYRLTILGFCFTIIGVLFPHIISSEFYERFIFEACLLFIVLALIKTMSSITRHLIVYGIRLKEIESSFISGGFWCKWGSYLRKSPEDSKTKTISIILYILNSIILVFILFFNIIICFNIGDVEKEFTILIFTLIYTAGFIYNFFEIYRKLSLTTQWDDVKKKWDALNDKQPENIVSDKK